MELLTIGRNYYPGRKVLLYHCCREDFSTCINSPDRLKLVCIESGTGIISINGKREILFPPCILCLNEKDSLQLEKSNNLNACSLYFHPSTLNASLTFDNMRTCQGLSLTETQDSSILRRSFITRDPAYNGFLAIDFIQLQKLLQLIALIGREINDQDNDFWPCKTRSYLYKLLIEIETLFFKPAFPVNEEITVKAGYADDIILYLHDNFHKKITIEGLAKELHTNRNTLRERFYQATGSTVMKYLNKIRVRQAALLLRSSGLLILEISEKVGFSDTTNFGRIFKKYIGCSPSEYRN